MFKGKVPNGKSKGCYAILEGEEVVYIGLGAKRGSGIYRGHGLNGRLKRYSRWDRISLSEKRVRVPVKQWSNVMSIHTIGFPEEYSYLAHALEIFLLRRLSPRKNTQLVGESSRGPA